MRRTKSESLYDHVLKGLRNIDLTPSQSVKFMEACERCLADNPDIGLDGLTMAAKIYLKLILKNTELTVKK